MTSTDVPEPPSDAEFIARVRSGDLEAFGELFARHHLAAERMARQLVPAADADDLASDAFAKVLDALRNGGGPDISFRAYLLTTVRRVHVDRLRAGKKVQSTDEIESFERSPESFDDPTVTGFESGAAAKAFASLPERWQAVLWHTEVEGEKPAVVAPLLGLTPNGVSALAYRAREGLRQAYLQQHLADVAGDRCRWTTERLGAYVRGGLTKREDKQVRAHLDECAKCTAVYLELVEVNSALPALLAPALLGAAGVGYLAATGAHAAGGGLLVGLWQKATENSTRTAGTAAGAVAVVVAAIIAALALTGGDGKPEAVIQSPPSVQPTQPTIAPPTVVPPTVKPPTVKPPTVKPTTAPPPVNPTEPKPTETQTTAPPRPTPTPPPPRPTPTPTPTPTKPTPPPPTTPILYEGLLTISSPRGGGSPGSPMDSTSQAAPPATEQRLLSISVPKGNTKPVVIKVMYGKALRWPVGKNPAGWACVESTGTCTARKPSKPHDLPISFATPSGGSAADRTFTVTARTGRLYDDDSQTLVAPEVFDENLLKVTTRSPDPNPDAYNRALHVAVPTGASGPVVLQISVGGSLDWPIPSSTPGWSCKRSAGTCTAANSRNPAPLYAEFDVPEGGGTAQRTFTVKARVGSYYDNDAETLAPVREDDALLSIVKPGLLNDPNPHRYNRFLLVSGAPRKVSLEISYGSNLTFYLKSNRGWTCGRASDSRRVFCSTDNYLKAERFDAEFDAKPGNDAANRLTVRAVARGRTDTDSAPIPPKFGW
ncbi:sigma-70 family RNA polymerase sigma factor [Kribbella sp. NBC_01245]|uniref:sigma-70 family RNA polymerase sigma factor n=1 Tax=Kribbella sp. NBC_01245 TaxID=2903578 RepID=UPI002E2BF546|nr:sigma-70 family RNA polymerase sigma factor [Kribbella sp. NBC_01245]